MTGGGVEGGASARDRSLAAARLAAAYGGILICIWFEEGRPVGIGIVALALLTSFIPRQGCPARLPTGLGWGAALPALLRCLPLLAGTLLLFLFAYLGGHWPGTRFILQRLAVYFGWGLLQQLFLQTFTQNNLRILHDDPRLTVPLSALLFGGIHLPNLPLVALSIPLMTYLCLVFRRSPSIFPLAIVHAAFAVLLDDVADLPMRIGPAHFGR